MNVKTTYFADDGEVMHEKNRHFTDAMNQEGYRFPSHKLGFRIFADVDFPKEMSVSDIGRMTMLSRLMIAKTNMLGYRDGREIKAYTLDEIAKLAGLKERQGRTFIKKMIKLNVISNPISTKAGVQYYVNPAYFMANGQRLSLDLFLLFRAELTPILPGWVIDDFARQARVKQI